MEAHNTTASSSPTKEIILLQKRLDDLLTGYLGLLNEYTLARQDLSNHLSSVQATLICFDQNTDRSRAIWLSLKPTSLTHIAFVSGGISTMSG